MSYGGEVVMGLVRDHGYTEGAACAAVLRHDALMRECARQGFLSTSVLAVQRSTEACAAGEQEAARICVAVAQEALQATSRPYTCRAVTKGEYVLGATRAKSGPPNCLFRGSTGDGSMRGWPRKSRRGAGVCLLGPTRSVSTRKPAPFAVKRSRGTGRWN